MTQTFTPEDDVTTIIAMFEKQLKNRQTPMGLMVRMRMKQGTHAEVRAAFARALPLTMRDRGALAFDLNQEAADPDSIVVYERWSSLDDLEAHLRTEHARALRVSFNEMIDGWPEFCVFTPADTPAGFSRYAPLASDVLLEEESPREPHIWHEVRIGANANVVFDALTDPDKIRRWWIPDTRGRSVVGEALEFWIGETCQPMRVATLVPSSLVRWEALEGDLSDWAGTRIEFRLRPQDGQCLLQFRQYGWTESFAKFPCYSLSWAVFLLSLKDYLEEGTGYPFPNRWVS